MQLENIHRGIINDRDRLQNGRYEIGNKWEGMELSSFKRLIAQQVVDLHALRSRREQIDVQRRQLIAFLNGSPTPQSRARFRASLSGLEQTPEMARLLRYRVEPIDSKDFVPAVAGALAEVLNRDGSLAAIPAALIGRGADTVTVARSRFEQSWQPATALLHDGQPVPPEQIDALDKSLADWRSAAEEGLAAGSPLERGTALSRLNRLHGVVNMLKYPSQTNTLRLYLRDATFPGGTVADLVHYLLDNNLAIRYGCDAQLTVKELGADWLRQLDGQMADVERRIAAITAQNPALTAALKRSLSGQINQFAGDPNAATTQLDGLPSSRASIDAPPPTDLPSTPSIVRDRGSIGVKPVGRRTPQPSADFEPTTLADRLPFLRTPSDSRQSRDSNGGELQFSDLTPRSPPADSSR